MTIYRARIYLCCNSMLIALERPQSSSWSFLSLMVRAGYVCVAIIHRTLTWTTGSLTRAQMLMRALAYRGVRSSNKSLHWKLTLGRKSLAAPGNRTCVSGVTVRCCKRLGDSTTETRIAYDNSCGMRVNTWHVISTNVPVRWPARAILWLSPKTLYNNVRYRMFVKLASYDAFPQCNMTNFSTISSR